MDKLAKDAHRNIQFLKTQADLYAKEWDGKDSKGTKKNFFFFASETF